MSQFKLSIDVILTQLAEDIKKMQTRTHNASEMLLADLDAQPAANACEVVHQVDRVKLKHYRPSVEKSCDTPLLIVYAPINRETILDLQPGRSVVRALLDCGIEIYLIDWGYPTRKDRFQGIDDYVNGYLDKMVEFVCNRSSMDNVNLMGICMGGTFSVIYAALHPDKVKNLITAVSPTNFDIATGLLHVWLKHIDADIVADCYGNIPADLMNFGFLLLNPARLVVDRYFGLIDNLDNRDFLENFIRMEKWIFDSPDLTGNLFREIVKEFYQKNLLIQNKFVVAGEAVDLKNITMPMLNFYAEYDHLVPSEACEMIIHKIGSRDATNICLQTGHIGIYVGFKCRKAFAPKIASWLRERDQGPESQTPPQTPPLNQKRIAEFESNTAFSGESNCRAQPTTEDRV